MTAEPFVNEVSSAAIFEEDALESLTDQRRPAIKAIAHVRGHVSNVVPELNDHSRNHPNWLACAVRRPLLNQSSHVSGAEGIVFGDPKGIPAEPSWSLHCRTHLRIHLCYPIIRLSRTWLAD